MPVDLSSVLHVLAHELRTPSGIAQGYLRMLLDDRLTEAADQRRAIEQTQKALTRVSELTAESSRLARWLDEQHDAPRTTIDAHVLVTRVVRDAGIEPLRAKVDVPPDSIAIATVDGDALTGALVSLVKVTARELTNAPCAMVARRTGNRTMDVLIGHEQRLEALSAGPDAPGTVPLGVERGGVGLSLVLAAAILETHGARQWIMNGSRTTVGIRFPLEERSHL